MPKSKASSSKQNTAKKTTAKKPPKNAQLNTPAPPVPEENYSTSIITAVIFLLLGIVVSIGFFNDEGSLVIFLSDLLKGLLGYGYYLTAPALFICSYLLFFKYKERKTGARCVLFFILPVIISALSNLILYVDSSSMDNFAELPARLFEMGQNLQSGGALGGLIAVFSERFLGGFGATVILLLVLLVCSYFAFNISLKSERNENKPSAAPVQQEVKTKEPVAAVAEKTENENSKKKRTDNVQSSPVKPRARIKDIPLGDDEETLLIGDEPVRTPASSGKIRRSRKPDIISTDIPMEEDVSEKAELASKTGVEFISRDNEEDAFQNVKIVSVPGKKTNRESEKEAAEYPSVSSVSIIQREDFGIDGDEQYSLPPVELLRKASGDGVCDENELENNRDLLENALCSFGINSKVINMVVGPTVTRYDIKLEQGIKLSRVTNLSGDLALALGVINVRIAPIPNQLSTVGIEVPNKIINTVYLGDVIDSPEFKNSKSKIGIALGKDIGGKSIIGDIAKLPHLLVAGTTGSGKSVCINSMILSILYRAKPENVRFIMIDPKMVELGVYNGIPQLLIPVVTDPKKAAGALQWAVIEMLGRYQKFSQVAVRDLEHYNLHVSSEGEETLPQIVIIIDELADLMMAASKEVEESICRIAQMGRAAGIHLIVATQRPSADVITGLMKANIPSRIAFAVSSALESRIILDQAGAEKLVGMGDMLFSPVGIGKPVRIQGAFVSDDEREDIIQYIKENSFGYSDQTTAEQITKTIDMSLEKNTKASAPEESTSCTASEYDELLPQAVEVVLEMKSCSVSMLQRRVKLGYSRAARIVDQMEELGVVGPYEGAKPRQLTTDRESWYALAESLGFSVTSQNPAPDSGTDSAD